MASAGVHIQFMFWDNGPDHLQPQDGIRSHHVLLCYMSHSPHTQHTKKGTCVCISGKKNLGKWVTLYVGVSEVVTHPNLSGFHNKIFFLKKVETALFYEGDGPHNGDLNANPVPK